jgi:aspartyl-tRNA(Asn)/glutamyl-tRNA(Gln) amidotransferase subunit B
VTTLVPTIGLEVHCQIKTQTKMFCACPLTHGAAPNTAVCPVCLGHPGTLPVVNDEAVHLAVRAGIALSCTVHDQSIFARKHYFYPDLPKGYQISQFDRPLCTGGHIHVEHDGGRCAYALERIHMEEDAGKLIHVGGRSLVDWNRGGTPLIEIVGKPDLPSAEAAASWFKMMHSVMTQAGVTTGDMEKGHFRCDANVSLAPKGGPLGTRVELKNINSFRFLAKAIRHEIARQSALMAAGERVVQSTRSWDGADSVELRSKENAADYRYFPDPDLGPVPVLEADRSEARAVLPAIPLDVWILDQQSNQLESVQSEYGISSTDASALLSAPALFTLFEASVAAGGVAASMLKWLRGPVARWRNESDGAPLHLEADQLVVLDGMVVSGALTRALARELLQELCAAGGDVEEMVKERGLGRIEDAEKVERIAHEIVSNNPDAAARFRDGELRVLGFFMGQGMRAFGGRVEAGEIRAALLKVLSSTAKPV